MPQILHRYATPLIAGLFVVSLVSGLALFFHVGPRGFHGMHEWLSLALVAPFALHLWRNWRPMTSYLRHAPMAAALALSAAGAALFLIPSGGAARGAPPQMAFASRVLQGTPAELAAALGTTPEAVVARLAQAGIAVSVDRPLAGSAPEGTLARALSDL